LLLKKLKGLICYLKNLKDQSVTNIKLKGLTDTFCLYNNTCHKISESDRSYIEKKKISHRQHR
jgi:hypothetical protein